MEPPFFPPPGAGPGGAGAFAAGLGFALASGFALAPAPPEAAPPGGAPAPPEKGGAPAPPAPADRSRCASCGGELARGVGEAGPTCRDCGLILEGGEDDEEDADRGGRPPRMASLRIVGPGSRQLQPNLFRSGPAASPEAQKAATAAELERACAAWRRPDRSAPGRDACAAAADIFYDVQRHAVKRSNEKRNILGACLYLACLRLGDATPKGDIAQMLGLVVKGLAGGLNFLGEFAADGKLSVEVNIDPCDAEIGTLFARLGLHGPGYAGLRAAAADVVRTATARLIGIHSVLRSKVAGATFAVLQRCRDPALIARPPTFADFCAGRGEGAGAGAGGAATRKNTIENFTAELAAYHSVFEPCYRRAGLDPAPPAPPARGAPRGPRRSPP